MTQLKKMRVPAAAEYLQLAQSTLSKMRCYGSGPRYYKVGPRIVVYDRDDLDAWLEDRSRISTSESK